MEEYQCETAVGLALWLESGGGEDPGDLAARAIAVLREAGIRVKAASCSEAAEKAVLAVLYGGE